MVLSRSSGWRKKRRNANVSKSKEMKTWRFGRRESKSKELLFASWGSWVKRMKMSLVTNPRRALSRLLRMQSKTELRSMNQCMTLSPKRGRLCSFRCSSTTKDKKSTSFRSSQSCIRKVWRELSRCWRKICKISTLTWLKTKKRQGMRLKRPRFRQERKTKRWLS